MVVGMGGQLVMLNPAAECMLGIAPEDIGKAYKDIFLTEAENDAFNEVILNTVYEKTKADRVPVDFVKNGTKTSLLLTTSYIYHDGKRSVVVVMNDVTKLNELRGAQIALEAEKKANEAKSRFLSNMSHEIRTPINAVLGMNEMILREAQDSEIQTYAANIRSAGKTLLFLINDILDMSKIESGKMEIISVNYEISAVVMDLWNIIYLRAREKNLTFSVEFDRMLPCVLYGDDVRIKQVVTNLLTNAVKYTPKGSVTLRITCERQGGDMLLLKISVQDTGIGIREEDMGKLFESFQRLDEEKNRNIEGTGLGMNITMSLLKMMDGGMEVESEYRKGSIFTVTLPQKIIDETPAGSFRFIQEKQMQPKDCKTGSFTAPEGCVLVVDDNAMNLTVFRALLKRTRLQVVTADSGKQCLEYAQRQKFHMIFMDHMMPEMDGIETLCELRKMAGCPDGFPNRDTPVIALTANAVAGARELYLAEGFQDFLTKPIDAEALERTICEYLPKELILMGEAGSNALEKEDDADEYDIYLQQGVSIKNGLKHSQGNMDTYIELVCMFIKDKTKIGILREYLTEHNMKDYAIQVHALKGNARMLGADGLADIAYDHEMQSRAGRYDEVNAHWNELEQTWKSVLETFEAVYEKYAPAHQENIQTYVSANDEALEPEQGELDKMAELIDAFRTDEAVEQIREWLKSPLSPNMRRRLEDVLSAVGDEFDEDKAIALLEAGAKPGGR